MTVLYFGDPWDAALFDPDDDEPPPERVPTPVGQPCQYCTDRIVAGDRGQIIPFVGDDATTLEPWHVECLWQTTWGHIEGVCQCQGFEPGRRAREAILARLNMRRAAVSLRPIW